MAPGPGIVFSDPSVGGSTVKTMVKAAKNCVVATTWTATRVLWIDTKGFQWRWQITFLDDSKEIEVQIRL